MNWQDFNSENLAEALANDGEFGLVSRGWTGTLTLNIGDETISVGLIDGQPQAEPVDGDNHTITGTSDIFGALLLHHPPRFLNDLGPALDQVLDYRGDRKHLTQYYAAMMRIIEVLRGGRANAPMTMEPDFAVGEHCAPVGRYVHLELGGHIHRIYYEEAGQGIPLLLQHTAGSHGTQWRHLLDMPEITDNFRLIAYDLPFHGKSVPPTGKEWWTEQYRLKGEILRSIPVKLSQALDLERPAFMGCSVGGVLALDLAHKNPDAFRATISLEGALKIDADTTDWVHEHLYHPQVSNEFKGRLMHSLTAPTAPEAYRRETIQTYMAGWPPVFIGDLFYYADEFNLMDVAGEIDTSRCAVHILNGEYDFSGSYEKGEEAHQAIKGSTHTKMEGMGHFPMCEDPERFKEYILPILDQIKQTN